MAENYWSEDESTEELDPISSLLSEWSDPEDEEEEFRSDFFQGLAGRRQKAAFMLTAIWGVVIALHWFKWGAAAVALITALVLWQGVRLMWAKPEPLPSIVSDAELPAAPSVSILVAAKNEETVIANLVKMLCSLDYPADKYDVWIIDDSSTDRTPEILDRLTENHPGLNVLHRPPNSPGGKSGALNEVLAMTKGDIIGVFDADAHLQSDLLRYVVPLFGKKNVGAVQVRKSIANADVNFWTRGQAAEMALDSYFQQQRISMGGVGELRGNGQFVSREALDSCGGWNEQTITDDLDLTIRLHLDNWKVDLLLDPAVDEEGVRDAISLWHQRNRWAEGGYQRYLDYWRFILKTPLGLSKKLDLFYFLFIQYLLPTAAIPDLAASLVFGEAPMLSPITGVILIVSFWGMFTGLRRVNRPRRLSELLNLSLQAFRGMIYMSHWFIIIPSVTARMSVRPKRLKWVKTVHDGTSSTSEVSA
ncbi:MAG: Beta-monoglucosyldiacylglycerol synthase [Chroococcopsis gigantea SAG 12.99]|jgi:1,2-diacylglycerol 3-beta-glucosyltransferase|nr:glycosyltransferase family 2 protein [Chlorogloea purpurea SAG 13.99]MDV2999903.1 Beta-monoglucosyldiacylglycerol synthase [Chroococcopsis gigantea SAG 12.99]